jgi:hypothetical protein
MQVRKISFLYKLQLQLLWKPDLLIRKRNFLDITALANLRDYSVYLLFAKFYNQLSAILFSA